MEPSLYSLLEIEPDATQAAIRRAYRELSLRWHPDRNADGAERMQAINAAYEVLGNPEKRRRYDLQAPSDGAADEDVEADFATFMSGFADFPSRAPRRAPDSLVDIEVTLEELFSGCVKVLSVERSRICGVCSGVGGRLGSRMRVCASCGGEGYRWTSDRLLAGDILQSRAVDCASCHGLGRRFRSQDRCGPCRGSGTFSQSERLEVPIPAGASLNEVLELEGAGDEAPTFEPGNLIVRLSLLPHATFAISPTGPRDLLCTISLAVSEALLGFSRIILIHLNGSGLLTRGEHFVDGDMVKVDGRGMPALGRHRQGDLYLRITIDQPIETWMMTMAAENPAELRRLLPGRPALPSPPDLVDVVTLQPSTWPVATWQILDDTDANADSKSTCCIS